MMCKELFLVARHLPEGAMFLDLDGTVLEANPAAAAALGLSPDALRRRPLLELAEDPPEKIRAYLDLCARVTDPLPGGLTLRKADGSAERVGCRAGRLSGPDGPGAGLIFLRFDPPSDAGSPFLLLKQKLQELGEEILRRRKAEESLRSSEERLRLALEAAALGTLDWDLATGEMTGSERMRELWGLDVPQAASCEAFLERIHPEDRSRVDAALTEARRPEGSGRIEEEFRVSHGRTGEMRRVVVRGQAYFDGHRRPRRLVLTILDVTEPRRDEEARARLAAVVESSDDAILTRTLEGLVTGWNDGARRIFGYAAEELLGRPAAVLIPPDRRVEDEGILERLRRGERIEHCETVRITREGRPIDVSLAISPLRDVDKRVVGVSEIARDVTEAKRAEEQVRKANALLSAVIQGTPDWVFLKDLEGRYRVVNASAARGLNRLVEDILGRTDFDLFPEDLARRLAGQDGVVLAEGPRSFENSLVLGGVRRTFLVVSAPYEDGEGRVAGVLGIARDITERKAQEDEIRRLNASLEEMVQERTRELREALRELESFSYTVAHDLRAPLRAMAGFSGLLLADYGLRLDEGGRACLQRIDAAARRMDALVQALLEYSRLTREEIELEAVEVEDLLQDALAPMEDEIRSRGARIRVEGPLPPVLGHRIMLRQVLVNLVSNALKFVDPGVAPEVVVRGDVRDGRVRIQVEDNGIGIAARHVERLFGVFERLAPDRYPGTGIGLAIVKKAVERMGGQAGVETQPGKGSRFWFELPAGGDPNGSRTHRALGRRQR